MKELIEQSNSARLFPNVHVSTSTAPSSTTNEKKLTLTDTLLNEKIFEKVREVSLKEFSTLLSDANTKVLQNGQLDVYHVKTTGDAEEDKLLSGFKNVAGLVCMAVEDSLSQKHEVV